jgi:hypothetical protein
MTLGERLKELISACFTGIWVQSHEHDDALLEIARLCNDENWTLASWDISQGLSVAGTTSATNDCGQDPLAALRALPTMSEPATSTILVLKNFHRFLQSAELVQTVARQLAAGKQSRAFLIVLSPIIQIPIELEKLFIVVEHELPSRFQLEELARGVATEAEELPSGPQLDAVLDAAGGLTRHEAEAAFSLSLVRHGRLTPDALWEIKSGMLKKSGLLQLHRGQESFDELGGLDALKAFCRRALRLGARRGDVRPRGVLLLGVPGTGKSALAKALGNETSRPTLTLDVGSLMAGIVGETERNIRQALRIVDAMAPCILFLDEVEKGLSGAASSGQTDSGVTARLFGIFLTWLNDHTTDVFTIATCNDISKLPPEFSRSERFDAIYFLDLPGQDEKWAIWRLYLRRFELDAAQPLPDDASWTGAEVRACCRLSALLDVPLADAARNIVPVAVTAAESVDRLRSWASGRCLDAARTGVYQRAPASSAKPGRRVQRNPSNN